MAASPYTTHTCIYNGKEILCQITSEPIDSGDGFSGQSLTILSDHSNVSNPSVSDKVVANQKTYRVLSFSLTMSGDQSYYRVNLIDDEANVTHYFIAEGLREHLKSKGIPIVREFSKAGDVVVNAEQYTYESTATESQIHHVITLPLQASFTLSVDILLSRRDNLVAAGKEINDVIAAINSYQVNGQMVIAGNQSSDVGGDVNGNYIVTLSFEGNTTNFDGTVTGGNL